MDTPMFEWINIIMYKNSIIVTDVYIDFRLFQYNIMIS